MRGNGHIPRQSGVAAAILLRIIRKGSALPAFAAPDLGLLLSKSHGLPEVAMSEVTQQTIALWILFTLLLLVPWVVD